MLEETTHATPTIQDLADLVRQQAGRLAELEAEVVRLRAGQSSPRSPIGTGAEAHSTAGSPEEELPVDRRGLMRKAGLLGLGAAVASTAAVASASPAAATVGAMQFGTSNDAGSDITALTSSTSAHTLQLTNSGSSGALKASSHGGGHYTFHCDSSGVSLGAIWATARDSWSIVTSNKSRKPTLYAINGYAGEGGAVEGDGHAVKGYAVAETAAGVYGVATSRGKGVWGDTSGPNHPSSIGVYGSSRSGRGASFGGKLAPLRLRPSNDLAHPAQGQRGDLFVERGGSLWYCKGLTNWVQLA